MAGLGRRIRHAVEFREPSWYDERVYARLRRHRFAMGLHDMHGFGYPSTRGRAIRLRSFSTKYAGRYEDVLLEDWAAWLAERVADGTEVRVLQRRLGRGRAA